MMGELFAVIAPVFACAAVGVGWSRWGPPYETRFVTALVVNVGTPCLILATLTKYEIDVATFGEMALASGIAIACFAAIGVIALRFTGLPSRAYLPSLMFGNCGNMGLPLSLFAFGEVGLSLAIAFFTVAALANFTIGSGISSGRVGRRELLTAPLNYAVLLSVIFMIGGVEIPPWIANPLQLIGQLTVPLMLITLGVSLARLRVAGIGRALSLSLLRLGMGFAVGYGLATLMGFEGAAQGVLIIQSAMPVAVFNYLFAQRDGRRPDEIAGLVVMSTIISFLTLPALLFVVL